MTRGAVTSTRPIIPAWLLAPRGALITTVVFLASFGCANRLVKWFDLQVIDIDRPPFWPIGVFEFASVDAMAVIATSGCILLFVLVLWLLERCNYRLAAVIPGGLALIVASNGLHGTEIGYAKPITGGSVTPHIQYFDDAAQVRGLRGFLHDFNANQSKLRDHARTHPPGAVLLFYALQRAPSDPIPIALTMAALSTLLASIGLWSMLRGVCGRDTLLSGFCTLLFLLLPAVQIYFLASIDGLVAASMVCAVACFQQRKTVPSIFGASVFLLAASLLTFAALFLPPVLIASEWAGRRRVNRSLSAIAIVILSLVGIYAATGFDWLAALRTASALENPAGFRLFAEPTSYLFTRIESVAEILLFLGPFLGIVAIRSWRLLRGPTHAQFLSAIVTLLAMFLAGAFHTAETARACLFLYPFLMLPIARGMCDAGPTGRQRWTLSAVVIGQSLAMQLVGDYFW